MIRRGAATFHDLDRSGLRGRMIFALTILVTLSVLALGAAALAAFNQAVEPELEKRTRLIGVIIRSELQRVLDLGIPIESVTGLDSYLSDALEDFQEIEQVSISGVGGPPLMVVERRRDTEETAFLDLGDVVAISKRSFVLPILRGNNLVGDITIHISPRFVQTRLRDVFLDVGVLSLVAILVAVELSLAVVIASVGKPLDRVLKLLEEQCEGNFLHCIRPGGLGGLSRAAARLNDHAHDLATRFAALPERLRQGVDARIPSAPHRLRLSDFNDIRLALFLFCLGTEIAAAFMPLYAVSADRPAWMTADIAAAAPLVFYLGAIAAVSPFGSALIRAVGARRLFLFSAPAAAAALAGLALSASIVEVTLWQGVMAAFYASATIAGQEYAIRAADENDRAKAVGAFVAVAYGGMFAGSALGGLIAGRFGYEAAFVAGAALSAASILLGLSSMRGRAGDRPVQESEARGQPTPPRRSWITGRYLALVLGVAVPMNMTMVIYIWYLTPLMLAENGSGPAEIARVLVLYNVAVFLLGPTVARIADGEHGPAPLLTLGAVISGLSLLSIAVWGGFWAIVFAVAGVGVGQVLMQTPIYATALRITGGPGPGIDALRLIERLGAIAGLAVSAVFLGRLGPDASLTILGVVVLTGVAAYGVAELLRLAGRRTRMEDP